jgi:hypothetical protein
MGLWWSQGLWGVGGREGKGKRVSGKFVSKSSDGGRIPSSFTSNSLRIRRCSDPE